MIVVQTSFVINIKYKLKDGLFIKNDSIYFSEVVVTSRLRYYIHDSPSPRPSPEYTQDEHTQDGYTQDEHTQDDLKHIDSSIGAVCGQDHSHDNWCCHVARRLGVEHKGNVIDRQHGYIKNTFKSVDTADLDDFEYYLKKLMLIVTPISVEPLERLMEIKLLAEDSNYFCVVKSGISYCF